MGDFMGVRPVQRQHVYYFIEQLVRAERTVRVQPGGKVQLAVGGVAAKTNVGVADIQSQQHGADLLVLVPLL